MQNESPGDPPPADAAQQAQAPEEKAAAKAVAPASGEVPLPRLLTAEEQMALYEKDLKENDWGHQPC